MRAGPDLEPRRRQQDRIDQRALDAVVDGRFVALVDDAKRHQEHARTQVEPARQQEVDVGLFELEFAPVRLKTLDKRVLQFQFADESHAARVLVGDEQDKPVEIEDAVGLGVLGVVDVHVAGDPGRRTRLGYRLGNGHLGKAARKRQGEDNFLKAQN